MAHLGDSEPSIWQNAVCDNLWKHNAGLVVAGAPRVFTARGTCCRHEGNQHFSLEYLRAFTMREVAAAGSPEVMERFRDEALAFIEPLVADLGLSGFLEDANDPFFLGGAALDHEGRPPSLPELPKIELRLQLYDGKSLACTSFNIHGDFFARSFRYRHEDGRTPVWTGCVAFGLERWVWAILVQHGPDPARWPPRLRALAGL